MAVAAMAIASCTKQEALLTVIHASHEELDGESRTAFSGSKVVWSSADAISVNGQASTSISISSTNPSSADFTLPLISSPYYAIYPASCFVAGSFVPSQGRYGSVNLPQEQTYTAGSFDPSASVMLGKSDAQQPSDIFFRHAVAWMRVTVNSAPAKITRIELSANGGEDMSGSFAFDPSSMKLVGGSESRPVRLVSASGVSSGTAMIISIPARDYPSGITLRVICANKTYCEKVSAKSFTAEPGKIYNTALTYVKSGTVVGAGAEDAYDCELTLTPYWELNAAGHSPNSHAGQTSRSTFTFVGDSYVEVKEEVTGIPIPLYPRFISTNDGRWLLFYHNGVYDAETSKYNYSGNTCYVAESYDMKHWVNAREVFPPEKSVISLYGGKVSRMFAGAHPLRLPDGRLMVVAAYRRSGDFRKLTLDNGLAFKYSSDEGRTWSETQTVNVGTCWEPRPIVLSSGRVVVYYTDSETYIENVWDSAVISTGSSYIYSDDNGASWRPVSPHDNHLLAFRMLRDSKNGNKVYTDQMPGVIELKGSKQLVAVAEANYAKCTATSTDYWINMAYSNSSGSWGSTSDTGELPSDRSSKVFQGAAPTIEQFDSGEIMLTYNYSSIFWKVQGDETGRSFGSASRMFGTSSADSPKGYGFWGSCYPDGHVLLAGTAGKGGAAGQGFFVEVGQYFLNHNIWASSHSVTVDGKNADWKKTDEAIFVGSKGPVHATLRASVSGDRLCFLAEVDQPSFDDADYVRIYLAKASGSAIHEGDVYIQRSLGGSTFSRRYDGSSWVSATLNTKASIGRGVGFYVIEFSVPLSSLPEYQTTLLLNFAVNDSVDGLQSLQPVPASDADSKNTSKWVKLYIKN